jgi:hypothetical protein
MANTRHARREDAERNVFLKLWNTRRSHTVEEFSVHEIL